MKTKNIYFLFFGVLCIIISICIKVFTTPNEMADFTKTDKKDIESYLYVDLIDMDNKNFYIVYKDNEQYVLKSKIDLSKYDFDGVSIKVVGLSKEFSETDKNETMILFNNYYSESEDSQINSEEFDNIFGKYYLEVDKVIDDVSAESRNKQIRSLFLEIGIALLVVFALMLYIDHKKQI